MPQLVIPSHAHMRSFLDAERELRTKDFRSFLWLLDPLQSSAEAILRGYANLSAGIDLPSGRVPSTTYWLIDDWDRFVGSVTVRHALSDEMRVFGGHIGYTIRPAERRKGYGTTILRLVLPKAHALGIDPALLTCDKTNIASRRIIEANGGVYESEVEQGRGLPPKLRFWVPTEPRRNE